MWNRPVTICVLFICVGFGTYCGINTIFPDDLGHTRTILFVPQNNGGYYIIDDVIESHIYASSDLYFYGMGVLTRGENSVCWKRDGVGLNLTILSQNVELIPITGKVYYHEQNTTTFGIRLHTFDKGSTRVVSLLYPFNDNSDSLPITKNDDLLEFGLEGWNINKTDSFFCSNKDNPFVSVQIQSISGQTNRMWLRHNENGDLSSIYISSLMIFYIIS
jgi:hypothetical protein